MPNRAEWTELPPVVVVVVVVGESVREGVVQGLHSTQMKNDTMHNADLLYQFVWRRASTQQTV